MFTGIVESLGEIVSVVAIGRDGGLRMTVDAPLRELVIGESIAVDGTCLTVVATKDGTAPFSFDLSPETLAKTIAGTYRIGSKVNVERAMRPTDRFGGHIVTGHVDTGARLARIEHYDDGSKKLWFRSLGEQNRWPEEWVVPKGSITVQGVSLTVVDVEEDGFSVVLVPHTLERTTLRFLQEGEAVNVEFDWMVKTLWNFTRTQAFDGVLPLLSSSATGYVRPALGGGYAT
jgi:riboflavin synthase